MPQALRRSLPAAALALCAVALLTPRGLDANPAVDDFRRFAQARLEALRSRADLARLRPEVRPGPEQPVITYRAAGEGFEIEVEHTGVRAVPFVAALHYTERVFSCEDVEATRCVEVASRPVTEIFRYRDGAWGH